MNNTTQLNDPKDLPYFKCIAHFWKHSSTYLLPLFGFKKATKAAKTTSLFSLFGGDEPTDLLAKQLVETNQVLSSNKSTQPASELIQPFVEMGHTLDVNFLSVVKPIAVGAAISATIIILSTLFVGLNFAIVFALPFLVPTLALAAICYYYSKLLTTVSKKLVAHDLAVDNNLKLHRSLSTPLFKWLNDHMDGFDRGHHNNLLGDVRVPIKRDSNTGLNYLVFDYICVHRQYKDSQGRYRTQSDTYNGVLISCSGLQKTTITPDPKVRSSLTRLSTVNSDFNKRFNAFGEYPLNVEALLTTTSFQSLLDLDKTLKDLNILITDEYLCLLFKSPVLDVGTTTSTLKQPNELLNDLIHHNSSLAFDSVLKFVDTLIKQELIKPTFGVDKLVSTLEHQIEK